MNQESKRSFVEKLVGGKKEAVLEILNKIIEATQVAERLGHLPKNEEDNAAGYYRATVSAGFLAKTMRDLIMKFDERKPIEGLEMRKFLHERFDQVTGPEKLYVYDQAADKILHDMSGFLETFLRPFGFGIAMSAHDCESCSEKETCDLINSPQMKGMIRKCNGENVTPNPVEDELQAANGRVSEGGRVHYQDMRKKQDDADVREHARNRNVKERIRREGGHEKN